MRHVISTILNFILLTLILSSCSCLSPVHSQSVDLTNQKMQYESAALHLEESTVALLVTNLDDSDKIEYQTICAGTMISPKLILSARHCLTPLVENPILEEMFPDAKPDFHSAVGMQMAFKTFDQRDQKFYLESEIKPYFATVRAVGEKDDLFLLIINDDFQHDYVPIGDLLPLVSSKVDIIGHPGRYMFSYLEGTVSGSKEEDGEKYFLVEAPLFYGSSGGGVFQNNRLIGVTSAISTKVPDVGFIISTDRIHLFLQNLN